MEEALVFEWDEAKADANYQKARVAFQVTAKLLTITMASISWMIGWTTARSAGYALPW